MRNAGAPRSLLRSRFSFLRSLSSGEERWYVGRSRKAGLTLTMLAIALSTACTPGFPDLIGRGRPADGTPRPDGAFRLGKVTRGDLAGAVSFSTDLRAKGTVGVVPRLTARLLRLSVDLGSRVREGDPIAELDRADFEQRVLQAQAAQAAAESRLADKKTVARPEIVAQAEANLRAADVRVQALEATVQGAGDVASLQRRVDDARASLSRAEAGSAPNPQASGQADAALVAARNRLNQILGDPARANDRPAVDAAREDVRRAEEAAAAARSNTVSRPAVDAARRELQAAEQSLALARNAAGPFDLEQARALRAVAQAQVKLAGAPTSPEEVKAAEAAVEEAAALAELARRQLADTTIRAPISGIVTEVYALVGGLVSPAGPIVTLIPPELLAFGPLDESQAQQVQAGQQAQVVVQSLPDQAFSGVVTAVAPVLDPRTRQQAVRVEVADPQVKLRPGMFALVSIQAGRRDNVLLVPLEAVARLPAPDPTAPPQPTLFVVVENRARRQRVVLGPSDGRSVEIVQGVVEGAQILLNPRTDLVDGELVVG